MMFWRFVGWAIIALTLMVFSANLLGGMAVRHAQEELVRQTMENAEQENYQ